MALYGCIATVILAIVFTCLQGIEYSVSSFTISDGIFGTCFFFGTGLIKVKPKLSSLKFYSTNKKITTKLSPYWITGFVDGEGTFSLRTTKNSSRLVGWRVSPIFAIELHKRDLILLENIKDFFGVGSITVRININTAIYCVQSFQDLINVIIPLFDKYLLLTQKKADFILFKECLDLLNRKVQSTMEGLLKIVSIRYSMNKGLSKELSKIFSNITPVNRPFIQSEVIPHSDWLR